MRTHVKVVHKVRSLEQLRDIDAAGVLDKERYQTIWRLLDGGARRVCVDEHYNVVSVD